MKRFRLFGILFLLTAFAFVAAQEKIVLKVKVQKANVRSEMSMTAPVIKEVKLGTLIEAAQKVGEWYEVSVTNDLGVSLTGYIHLNTVDEVGAPPAPTKPAEVAPRPQPAVTAPVSEAPPRVPRVVSYAGGFKVLAAYGMGSFAYTSDANTQALDKFKKSRTGFGGGVGYESGGRIGFEVDLMYLPKGVKYSGSTADFGADGTFEVDIDTAEVSVPVLLKFTLVPNPAIYLLGGGEIAYVMNAKAKIAYDIPSVGTGTDETDFKDTDDINQIDYGVVFGGGVRLPLGGMNIVVEARYHLGMANLQKNAQNDFAGMDYSPKTTLFLILAGLRF
jgi:hypothetical protein